MRMSDDGVCVALDSLEGLKLARELVARPDLITDDRLSRLHSDGWAFLLYHHPEFLDRCRNIQDLRLMIVCHKQRLELLKALIGAPGDVTQ